MTPEQYRKAIERLKLSQVGSAKFLRVDPRTVRRWIAGDLPIPEPVAKLLTLMVKYKIKPDKKQPVDILAHTRDREETP